MTSKSEIKAMQEGEIQIGASPAQVYALISDVTRTGEWSPECRRCKWVDGASGPTAEARFRGYNRYRWMRWSRLNEVQVADPGREFAFRVLPDWFNRDSSIWSYRLEANDGGTRLSERTEVFEWPGLVVRLLTSLVRREDDMTDNIQQSLERIKGIVEAEAGTEA